LRGTYFDIGFPEIEDQALERAKKLKDKLLPICEPDNILNTVRRKKKEFEEATKSDEWIKMLPGRHILKLFIGKHGQGLAYELFRNQLVHEIKAKDRVAKELKDILNQVLKL